MNLSMTFLLLTAVALNLTATVICTDLSCAVLNMSVYDDASRFFNRALHTQVVAPDSEGDEPVVIELIIHRSTKGMEKDERYAERQKLAMRYGYMWGAYHFARPSEDPVVQADRFLRAVAENIPYRATVCKALLVLDLEYYKKTKQHLGLKNAAVFIQRVKEKTGRNILGAFELV